MMEKVHIIRTPSSTKCPKCGGKIINGRCKKCGYYDIRQF